MYVCIKLNFISLMIHGYYNVMTKFMINNKTDAEMEN